MTRARSCLPQSLWAETLSTSSEIAVPPRLWKAWHHIQLPTHLSGSTLVSPPWGNALLCDVCQVYKVRKKPGCFDLSGTKLSTNSSASSFDRSSDHAICAAHPLRPLQCSFVWQASTLHWCSQHPAMKISYLILSLNKSTLFRYFWDTHNVERQANACSLSSNFLCSFLPSSNWASTSNFNVLEG